MAIWDCNHLLEMLGMLGVVASSGTGLMIGGVGTSAGEQTTNKGRIRQSIAYWCVQKYWSVERTCQVARELGCRSVQLVEPKDWPILKKYGLDYIGHYHTAGNPGPTGTGRPAGDQLPADHGGDRP